MRLVKTAQLRPCRLEELGARKVIADYRGGFSGMPGISGRMIAPITTVADGDTCAIDMRGR